MVPSISLPLSDATASALLSGLPGRPATGVFWVMLTWVIIPGMFLIWIAYHRRRERIRAVHRKLRQLQIRLAGSTSALSVAREALPRPNPRSRPSPLTTGVLLPPSAASSPLAILPPGLVAGRVHQEPSRACGAGI